VAGACKNYWVAAVGVGGSIFDYRQGGPSSDAVARPLDSASERIRTMLQRPHGVAARRRRTLDALVCHVAEASVEAICHLVQERVEPMGPAEARGYVRARAAREIRQQTRLAFSQQPGVDPAWQLLIVIRATERVVPLAMRRLAALRVDAASTDGQASQRRAA
jgi:hypothetical protein